MKEVAVIGITTGRGIADGNEIIRLGEVYVQAVLRAGGVPLLLPPVGKLPLETVLPRLEKVVVERHTMVRRARLFFLRDRTGKGARLKQKF